MTSRHDLEGAIAVTRFGLGARSSEIAEAARDPRSYLKAQIRAEGAERFDTDGETATDRLVEFRTYREQRQMDGRRGDGDPGDAAKLARQVIRQNAAGDILSRIQLATTTDASFRERWALFWANHFTVSANKVQVSSLVGPFENEAIRPHVFGRFAELLAAAETHPAMLLYLDQAQSVGPNSRVAQARTGLTVRRTAGEGDGQAPRIRGLNENLAREILELHTVGVDGGYHQADVTEFARALTGLGIAGPGEMTAVEPVVFRAATHEPGARRVMGAPYPAGGETQAASILADLAAKPATARFVCTKIARHFTADEPPPALVARLEKTWLASGGDLARVAETLIDAPEAWAPQPAKLKTPYEVVVSSYRAVGQQPRALGKLNAVLNGLGQRPFSAPSPKGWPDEAAPWAASDALVKRLQFAQSLAAAVSPDIQDPNAFAETTLGARLTLASATAIRRAESRAEAVALLLMIPEFQRR